MNDGGRAHDLSPASDSLAASRTNPATPARECNTHALAARPTLTMKLTVCAANAPFKRVGQQRANGQQRLHREEAGVWRATCVACACGNGARTAVNLRNRRDRGSTLRRADLKRWVDAPSRPMETAKELRRCCLVTTDPVPRNVRKSVFGAGRSVVKTFASILIWSGHAYERCTRVSL